MEKRYQIFVSSTYDDLQQEREHVINELHKVGYLAVGMEQFPATDEGQIEYIRPIIDRSDYYVVIVRGRYGSLTGSGISYTETECDYALEMKKPVLSFLFKDPSQLKRGEFDNDPASIQKLEEFRKKLQSRGNVKFWENSTELVNHIKNSIFEIVANRPGVGWIRGDQALDPAVYKELEDERRKNAELRAKLDKFENQDIVFPSHLAHGNDIAQIEYTVSERVGQNTPNNKYSTNFSISWDDLFQKLVESIRLEESESGICTKIREIIREISKIDKHLNVAVKPISLEQVRHHFEALGLIKAVSKARKQTKLLRTVNDFYGLDDVYLVWTLTDKGRQYISQLKAARRPSGS